MDHEYLQHIESSPYVDEGFSPADIKAKGAGLAKRLGNVLPSEQPYQTPKQAQLASYFNTFINEIKNILQEFSVGPTSPAERLKKMQLSPEEQASVDALVGLYEKLVPSVFPAGWSPQTKGQLGRQIATKPTTQGDPKYNLKTIVPEAPSLKEMAKNAIKEAWPGRAWARGKGEASGIIQKYIDEIKAAYSKFLKNVSKLYPESPKTNDLLGRVVKRNVPQAEDQMTAVEDYVKNASPEQPPQQTPPPQPAPAAQAQAPATAEQPYKAATTEQQSADDFADLVAKALQVINTRVREDTAHSKDYFSKPIDNEDPNQATQFYLPSKWDEPNITPGPGEMGQSWGQHWPPAKPEDEKTYKQSGYYKKDPKKGWTWVPPEAGPIKPLTEDEKDIAQTGKHSKETSDEPFEQSGKFVYDFAALWSKHRQEWSIEATEGSGVKITLPSGKIKVMRVFWAWKKTRINIISIATRDEDSNEWEQRELMTFTDDQVNPRIDPNAFNIQSFVEEQDPDAGELLKEAKNPAVLKNLQNQSNIAKPAFYALIRRKGPMAFVSATKDAFGLIVTADSYNKQDAEAYGRVKATRGKYKDVEFSSDDLLIHLFGGSAEDRKEWNRALTNLKYFEKFPDLQDKFSEMETKVGEARVEVTKIDHDIPQENIDILISSAIQKYGKQVISMTPQQLAQLSIEKAKSEGNTTILTKAQATASKSPVEKKTSGIVGWDDKGAVKIKDKKGNVIPIGASYIKDLDDDTRKELLDMGYWNKFPHVEGKPSEEAKTQTLSTPPTAPPTITVQAPSPSASSSMTTPTTPSKPDEEPEKKAEANVGSVKFDDKGVVHWTKPDGTLRKFTPKQINNMASPRLMIALKKAGYPFEKFGVKLKEDLNEEFVNPFNLANLL